MLTSLSKSPFCVIFFIVLPVLVVTLLCLFLAWPRCCGKKDELDDDDDYKEIPTQIAIAIPDGAVDPPANK